MRLDIPLLNNLLKILNSRFPTLAAKWPALMDLIRLDKPIGVFLLLWPTLTALWIAAAGWPGFKLLLIFSLGTFLMRSAGCCVNDFADYRYDGQVARTAERPLVSGRLERHDAFYFFLILCSLSFILVSFTNRQTMLLAFGAVFVAFIYPFMKRFTSLPQVVLGVAFSWGILMAFTATRLQLPPGAFVLFVANLLWTVAYDTEYAMVDRDDDLALGIKSTAILFGTADRAMIGMMQAMFLFAIWLAGRQFGLGLWFLLGLLVAAGLLVYQQFLIRDRRADGCFKAFLNNNWVGLAIFAGVVLHYLFN